MPELYLGALRQSLYHLIEFGDKREARKCLELVGKDETHEIFRHLTEILLLLNQILREETFAGAVNTQRYAKRFDWLDADNSRLEDVRNRMNNENEGIREAVDALMDDHG